MSLSTPGTERTQRIILQGLIVVSFVFFVTTVLAASTAQEMYAAAMAREETVRAALAEKDGDVDVGVAARARAVVAAYEEIVRLYPASGYSDNALWQAGRLSIDAFLRFGAQRDKNAGIRLLRHLTTGYPTSRQVLGVPEQLARLDPAPSSVSTGPPPARSLAATGLQAGPKTGVATIKNIRREVLSDAVRITIELDHEVAFHDERIPDPVRVFVDLPSTRPAPALLDKTLRFDGDTAIVRQIRIGRHPNATTRVVLDAAGVSSYSVYPLYDPYRLVIDCVREPEPVVAHASNHVSTIGTDVPRPSPAA